MTVCMHACHALATHNVSIGYSVHISLVTVSEDYGNTTADLKFGPSSKHQCVQIPVINDMVPETPEYFRVKLAMATPLSGIVLTPDVTTIVINDDDGK